MANKYHIVSNESDHSPVSPSSAHRWIECPASVGFIADLGSPNKTGEAAAKGTVCHFMAEHCLIERCDAGVFSGASFNVECNYKDGTTDFYHFDVDLEMIAWVDEYVAYCLGLVRKNSSVGVERRLDFTGVLTRTGRAHGSADFVVQTYNNKTGLFDIDVVDLKTGTHSIVDAAENPQLRLYAFAACLDTEIIGGIGKITTHVVQPSKDHVSTESLEIDELSAWYQNRVAPAVDKIEAGTLVDFNAGDVQCLWCPARGDCKTYEQFVMGDFEKLTKSGDKNANLLTLAEKLELFSKSAAIIKYINALKKDLLASAIENGAPEGFKLVEGRRMRYWLDVDKADAALARQKVPVSERRTKPELLSPAKIEKIIGADHAILEKYVAFTEGKPTLVPESDRRPEMDAASDFDNLKKV